jgi:alpha-mannosidase
MVYEDAEKLYTEVREDGTSILDDAFKALFSSSSLSSATPGSAVIAYNTSFFPRCEVVKVPISCCAQDQLQRMQLSKDGQHAYTVTSFDEANMNMSPVGLGLPQSVAAGLKPVSGMFPRSAMSCWRLIWFHDSVHQWF